MAVISEWKTLHGLDNVPTVAMGSSAGGYIISTLSLRPGLFEFVAFMISSGLPEVIEVATSQYPPVIFIQMPKDEELAEVIADTRRTFASRGILSAETRWYEHPLTPEWYTEMIPGVDLPLSMKIIDHMRDEGWLDEASMITSDDFVYDWSAATVRWNLTQVTHPGPLLSDAIYEETMVAYARHISFARKNDEMFAWFEATHIAWQENSISAV